ncbi:ATP-binding protein [Halorubellus sp. JP-L1]|uniref:ATP-binding protein n=1 Tax=Halorubellus sp. JP-L1 TaxID=2715753 RepID=UPI00140DD078|nr:ATP-binding protein [Halorubellus sp. JP-L1]NHN42764.1 ATP-binding protein [Halorubellus sp. JP-L1]
MAQRQFVNRASELELLESRFERDAADLIVVYGRRRLGKSELVREAIRDRNDAIYWQATEETPHVQLDDFVDTATETYPSLANIQRDWEPLLQTLGEEDAIVILDEFPYLIESDDAVPSKLQRVWDMHLRETGMTLVLVGSSISVMEDKVLSGGSPLYGRRTATIDLPPLDLTDAQQLYPASTPDESIQTWGVFGGTPYYLQALDASKTLPENIRTTILSEHGILHNEPEFLLRTEFGIREPQTYYTILRAIATGKRATSEIADFAGVDSNKLGAYLSNLRQLRLVERDIPVTADPTSTRKSRYRLNEPLFRFWFRYVYGQSAKLQQLGDDAYEELIAPSFTEYMGPMFERVCQRRLPALLSKTFQGIGYWWHKQHELDVVGLTTDGTVVAGECKYTSREMHEGDLADLERSASVLEWTPPNGADLDYHYCCFCRSGFSGGLRETATGRDDLSLFTPRELLDETTHVQ